MSTPYATREFVIVVPVKQAADRKSRLADLGAQRRADLALGFALDTVSAALATPEVLAVLVVTDDAQLASSLSGLGCAVIPDGATGLNEALVQGAAEARRRWPDARPAALLADLPCLTPGALSEALRALPDGPGFVRDHHGTGTTLYSADVQEFAPRFGRNSAAAHVAGGATEVIIPAPRVRLDVDDAVDLDAALDLGVGPYTGAVLEAAG